MKRREDLQTSLATVGRDFQAGAESATWRIQDDNKPPEVVYKGSHGRECRVVQALSRQGLGFLWHARSAAETAVPEGVLGACGILEGEGLKGCLWYPPSLGDLCSIRVHHHGLTVTLWTTDLAAKCRIGSNSGVLSFHVDETTEVTR